MAVFRTSYANFLFSPCLVRQRKKRQKAGKKKGWERRIWDLCILLSGVHSPPPFHLSPYLVCPASPVVGKMTTFDLWPLPLRGGPWGAGTNMWHPETSASYESLPAPLAAQIPTLWIHTSGGRGHGGALILDWCQAFDLFASVNAHLCASPAWGYDYQDRRYMGRPPSHPHPISSVRGHSGGSLRQPQIQRSWV